MFTEFDLTDGPIPIHVTAGPANGPPLMLLHGVGRRGLDFLPIVPALATRWHLHLIDLRGHGGSGRAPGQYRVGDHVEDALSILNWLGRPTVLFGHSLGALVAAGVAASRQELVKAIILEDPPSSGFLKNLQDTSYHATFVAMRRLAGSNRDVGEVARELGATTVPTPRGQLLLSSLRDGCALRFIARCLADVDGDVFTPILEGGWLNGYDEQAIWRGITCPALLLRGDPQAGGMLPSADANAMRTLMSDTTRIDFESVGHLIHGMATEATVRHVLNFLESLP
ncbi:MAG TPA: alpha/beta hydrolase [Gemmataceae bacterium]|nr:alpha/beta hydrolase [Gemmataceae bacterium]